ncbi:hypothetical protein KFL_008470010 [Klebsormidium nitens]|uniref:Uncharacterized protein n=1 Tax=Klebsormidium nitens TaxID=105231 RepID=A0A1Y1ILJ7_KLENI|nr:hypothetical protein KFL_008470010 [Klebsormidium nitens]|eukprot:GAQ91755.1 hypothetical protein KFL_008470010 [Klebsormidium nitens]
MINGIRKRAATRPDSWDDEVPSVVFGYRVSIQSSVGYTPFELLYGREPALPVGTTNQILLPVTDNEDWDIEEATDHLLRKLDTLDTVHEKALRNLEKAQTRQKKDFDNRHRTFEHATETDEGIEVGDYVIVRTAKRSKVHSHAITGAFRVVGIKARKLVEVEDRVGHVKRAATRPDSWDDEVPSVVFGYRVSIQSSVGYTPFELLYGREPALPVGTTNQILLPVTDNEDWDIEEATDHLLRKLDTLDTVHEKALRNLEKAQTRQKKDFDNRHRTFEHAIETDEGIEVGDYVIVRTAQRSKVHSHAITGAFKVVGIKARKLVEVEDRVGQVYPYHLNNVELLLKKSQVDEDMLEQGFLGN